MRRVREGGLSQLVLAIPALYVLAALATAVVTPWIDVSLGSDVPLVPQFGGQNARTMLGPLVGAYVTVTALVFWVRILAVQFSADEFSSRLMRYFLADRAQQHSLGALLGGLAYTLVVVQAIPDQGAGAATVPHLSVGVSMLVAVAVAATIVLAIYSGARQPQIGRLVRWLADEAVDYVRREHPDRGSSPQDPARHEPEEPPAGESQEVRAADSGWVQRVDEQGCWPPCPRGHGSAPGARRRVRRRGHPTGPRVGRRPRRRARPSHDSAGQRPDDGTRPRLRHPSAGRHRRALPVRRRG